MNHHRDALDISNHCSHDALTVLTSHRKLLHKKLFAKHSKEIIARAKLADRWKITATLKGNSTKRFVQNSGFVPLPLALNDIDDHEKLICSPEGVKATTQEYFKRLYHSCIPTFSKPWMNTASVVDVRSRITKDPFKWPRKVSLADLQAMLCRGNNRPSPGPDQWEKWTVKSLSDFALSKVLHLVNY